MTNKQLPTLDIASLARVTGGMNLDNFQPSQNVEDHRTNVPTGRNVDWTPTPQAGRAGF